MATVEFKRGLLANLPNTKVDGTIYVTTDEHAMYIDNGNQRIRLGDFIPVDTVADLPATGHAYETAVYYVKQGNILARYDGTNNRWVQINKAGVVNVQDAEGTSGNVITGITTSVNSATGELSLVLTRASVATSQGLANLTERVETLEDTTGAHTTALTTLNGNASTEGSVDNKVQTAINALKGNVSNSFVDIAALETAINALNTLTAGHTTAIEENSDDISALETTVGQHTTALNTLNGNASVTGSVDNKVAAAIAGILDNAPESFDTLKEIATWISTHGTEAANLTTTVSNNSTAIETLQDNVADLDQELDDLASRVLVNEGAISDLQGAVDLLNGNASTQGSVAYAVKEAKDALDARIDGVEDDVDLALDKLTWKDFT